MYQVLKRFIGLGAGVYLAAVLAASASAQSKPEVWSYDYAKQKGLDAAFPPPTPPLQFLSGVLWFTAEQAVVVMGDMDVVTDKDRQVIGMAYGMAALNAMGGPDSVPSGLKCSGTGERIDAPLRISAIPGGMDEITAATLCAHALHKQDAWRFSQLMADDQHYYAVAEYRTPANELQRVHVDVTAWAEKMAGELH